MPIQVGPLAAGCIRFTVPYPSPTSREPVPLVLDVPIATLEQLVFRPVRWLKLVAWGVLGCEGDVVDARQTQLALDLHINDIQPGEYTFVRAQNAPVHLINLEHTRTTARSIASHKSADYNCPDPAPANREAVLADRDGGRCVFSGTWPVQHAHVIPQRFSHMTTRLRTLSDDRDFGIQHHLDPSNTISVIQAVHDQWDHRLGFILATEDRFLRNQDVPPRSGSPRGAAMWTERPEPQDHETAYIWQLLPEHQLGNVVCDSVRPNERARFRNPRSQALPSPAAVNYIYAAGMVRQFLQEDVKSALLSILSRSEQSPSPPSSPSVPSQHSRPDDESPDGDDDAPAQKRHKHDRDSRAFHGAGARVRPSDRVTRSHDHAPADKEEMGAFEFLFRLTHEGEYLHYYDNQQHAADEAKARSLDEWRMSLPGSGT